MSGSVLVKDARVMMKRVVTAFVAVICASALFAGVFYFNYVKDLYVDCSAAELDIDNDTIKTTKSYNCSHAFVTDD